MRDGILKDDFGRGRQALRLLRDATADHICDIGILGAQDDFRYRSTVTPMDRAVLVDAQLSSWFNDRTPSHIARGGLDHYQMSLCLEGEVTFAAGRRSVTMRPGDLCLMDMAQASRTSVTADHDSKLSRVLTLILPRFVLAPLLAAPDAATASLVSRDSVKGRLLAAQFLALYRGGADAGASAVVCDALAGVIADAVGSACSAGPDVERANGDLLVASIKRYIDVNLQTDLVNVEHLCRQFHISRATLYRLFEVEGGLWRHVQDQRLNRAFRMLASPATGRMRMIDMAVDFNFSSDSTFVRAFRRRFGLTPGEVKRLSELGAELRPADGSEAADALLWLRNRVRD